MKKIIIILAIGMSSCSFKLYDQESLIVQEIHLSKSEHRFRLKISSEELGQLHIRYFTDKVYHIGDTIHISTIEHISR